ncbi:hypothetical protein KKA14_12285, partial [bacterium]|nr:hypothetical protein [bacterium]
GKTYANPDSLDGVIAYDYASSTMKVWKQGETVRVSYIQISGMDHRWPSGDGVAAYGGMLSGNYYVDGNFGNYSTYVTNFLFKNNMRTNQQPGIKVTINNPTEGNCIKKGTSVSIITTVNSDNGVQNVVFSVNNNPEYTDSTSPYSFTWNTTGLTTGTYAIKAIGTDLSVPALTDEDSVTVSVQDQCAAHEDLVFEHSKEVIMNSDLFNITGKYGVALAGGTFLHGSGTDKRTFPRETIVSTSAMLNIPTGSTIKYAFLYYGGLIGVKGNYRECDTCPLTALPTVNKWDSSYNFMGDYTPDGLNNEDDVRNNKITFSINGQNYGPFGPETASQPSPQPIGNTSKIDWEHLAKIMQGTLQGTAFTIWSNRIDITGLIAGKTGTVNLTVNPPDELDVNVNAQGQTGGNIIGSTDYNSCLDSGSWTVVVVYENPVVENKNIVMKDELFLRASDYSWHLYGEHGRRHTKINHAPIQDGAKLYLYSMMGHEANFPVPLSPTCSCGCAGNYFLSNNSGGTRLAFYSDIAEDVITDDPVHSDKTNGPWYLHSYVGSGQKNVRGNDYTRVISGSKVATFPNLYEGKGTAGFPSDCAGDGITTYENENQWTTDGESYRGHDWTGQGLITYHAADNSISLLEMKLDPSKITAGETETWVSIKANQKQVFKPMDRIALRFLIFETPAVPGPQFSNVQASGSGQQISFSGGVVKEGGDIAALTISFVGTNAISDDVTFGPYN